MTEPTMIERVADAWHREEQMWSGPHWNGTGMSGRWEAKRRADPAATIKFGDGTETVRLREVDSADAVRELNQLVRLRCARAALEAMRVENVIYYVAGRPNASPQAVAWNDRIDAALTEVRRNG